MGSISDLLTELKSLPTGYLSKKKIKGRIYYYRQYLINDKIHSEYIPKNKIHEFKSLIKRRKEIEQRIKELRSRSSKIVLSKNLLALNGFVMMGDTKVAKYRNANLVDIDKKRAPLYLIRTGNIEEYFRSRTIDLTRPNARILLKTLNIQDKNQLIALYAHGATISDNYWFKPFNSKLKYKDICFDNDQYSNLALKGEIIPLRGIGSPSPEITAIGSFEKGWKIINGEWWLYKAGTEDNIFSELFSAKFAKLLGIKSAIYEYDNGYIRTKNFANQANFEPMFSLCGDNEEYAYVFSTLMEINPEFAKDYLMLLVFDAIIYNVDRHNQNYGLLRDKKTGAIISLAPNFDNNMALLSYNKTLNQNPSSDGLINLFVKFVSKNQVALKMFKAFKLPSINKTQLLKIIHSIPIKRDDNAIVNFVLSRLEYFRKLKVNL